MNDASILAIAEGIAASKSLKSVDLECASSQIDFAKTRPNAAVYLANAVAKNSIIEELTCLPIFNYVAPKKGILGVIDP